MRYVRCKCGNLTGWTSMGTPRCLGCPDCGSDMAGHPDAHRDPQPHDFSASVQQMSENGPVNVPVCRWCHRTKWETENKDEGAA